MPELPEVETIVRDLRPCLEGRTLLSLRRGKKKLRRPWQVDWDGLLPGSRIEAVRRRGKWIVLDLTGRRHLIVHLGMTGQLVTCESVEEEPSHLHLVLDLDNGRQLRFRDIRRFGSVTLVDSDEALVAFFEQAALGPEPWDLERRAWHQQLHGSRRILKAILLDQQVVAGVGNIYADEALFEARLHPSRRGNQLSPAESDRLRKSIMKVLERAIQRRGSTIRDYVGGLGLAGGYQEEFRVYGRTGQPCVRCDSPIERQRLAGRSSHYCPRCQPEVASDTSDAGRGKLIADR